MSTEPTAGYGSGSTRRESQVLRPRTHTTAGKAVDHTENLPPELRNKIASMLPSKDLRQLKLSNKQWMKTANYVNARRQADILKTKKEFKELLPFIIANPTQLPVPIKVEVWTRDKSLSNFHDTARVMVETEMSPLHNNIQHTTIWAKVFGFSVQLDFNDTKLSAVSLEIRKGWSYARTYNFETPDINDEPFYTVLIEHDKKGTLADRRYQNPENAHRFFLNKLKNYIDTSNDFWIEHAGGLDISLEGVDTMRDLVDKIFVPYIAHAMEVVLETQDRVPEGLKRLLSVARTNAGAGAV